MFTEFKPMLNETKSQVQSVRFASIGIDQPSTPAFDKASYNTRIENENEDGDEDKKSSIEVDLSTLISQAKKQHNQENPSILSSYPNDSEPDRNQFRKKWDLSEIPKTAFGGIVRIEDDSPFDYKTISTHHNGNTPHRKSPLSKLLNNLPQPPKTAPLPPSQSTFQPFNEHIDDISILPNHPPTTPYDHYIPSAQTPFLQQPSKTSNPFGLSLSTPINPNNQIPNSKSTLRKEHRLMSSIDNVNNVKSHLEGLSIHIEGLFDQVKEVEELKKEVKYWKDVCLGLEIGKKDLENLIAQTQQQQVESKFTTVLIDGDNYIFHSRFLQSGFEGGQEAAILLLTAIKERTEVTKVIVQIFLNKSTLGATLIKNGIVQTWATYDQFWQGFSSSSGLTTVCDLGSGGENSRGKLQEYLQLYSDDAQCGQVILGADASLISGQSAIPYENQQDKVIQLEQDRTYNSVHNHSHISVNIPELFQTIDLVPLTAKPIPNQANTDYTSVDQVEVYEWSSFNSDESKAVKQGRTNIKISSVSSNYDSLGELDDLSPKRKFRKPTKYNKVAAEQVRKLDPRPCHTHYLSEWGCRDVDACSYGHSYHLSTAQLGELARMAKSVICPYMKDGRCRYDDEECVYGHKCPSSNKCPFRDSCRFRAIPNGHGELD